MEGKRSEEMKDIIIPAEKAQQIYDSYNEMEEMYADENRSDYFDADDIAIWIAREVGELIAEQK